MKAHGLRAVLAADPDIGAGNVLSTVLAHGADPAGPGLTFDTPVDGRPAAHPITLGELDTMVDARAAWLHARGIRRRDPVAVWATAAADIVLTYLALTRIGAIPALMNGRMAPEIAAEYIRRLRPRGVLADKAHAELLTGHDLDPPGFGMRTELLGEPAELGTGDPAAAPPRYRHHQDDPVSITHTSGTTGVPKAVLHSHRTLFAATRHLLTMPQAQGTGRILNALPIPHTATILMVNQVLGNRAEMLCLSQQDGDTVLAAIEQWRPEAVYGFAVTWAGLARFDLAERQLDSVRLWFNTGDCAHEAHIRRLVAVGSREVVTREGRKRVPGSHFLDGLGSSEMGHNGFHVTHTVDSDHYGRRIGRPYSFTEAAVLDEDGVEVPIGQVGRLGFRSPSLSPGYWNDSVTTNRARVNGWFLTGDLVHRDEEGNYYHVDRSPDAVAKGGFYTALSEERILTAMPDVVDCTVVITGDDRTEDGGVYTEVLLELDPGADTDADRTEAVRAALGEPVGATLAKVTVIGKDELPVTVTGKVRKFLLRHEAAEQVRI
ncbi:MAG TPA: class I adenylate-forming enzyme family protein [Actinophytocola sp.]|jgi:acyl-coenzyme A synthetase/AMP-(fatty) acid ligase|uniref:class I adenylate-forming enzyme family protein n=1 Tax=Actinophytocola sp. TaxID=1872138 RepID=UPI002F936C85